MDRVELNKNMGRVPLSDTPDGRAQDLRLACLQCAVTGTMGGMNDPTVLRRAAAFEAFVLRGAEPAAGQTQAWTGDEIQAEALKRAAATLNPAGPAAGDGPPEGGLLSRERCDSKGCG
jgi:hypothetical protein